MGCIPRQFLGMSRLCIGSLGSAEQEFHLRCGVKADVGPRGLHGQQPFKIVAAVGFLRAECQYLQVFAGLAETEETEDEVGELSFFPPGVTEFQLRIIRGALRVGEGKSGGVLAIVCGSGGDFFHPAEGGRGLCRAEAGVVCAPAVAQFAEQSAERVGRFRRQVCGF